MGAKVIFFDIGHTLATGAEDSPRRLLGASLGLSEKETRQIGQKIMTHPATEPSFLAEALASILPGRRHDEIRQAVERLWESQLTCVKEVPGATPLLRSLRAEGYTLGIISNIWHPFFTGFCRTCSEILELVDFTVLSYRTGSKKPAIELYRHAVEMAGVPASQCWMIGDTYELDMKPAHELGMRTVWVLGRPEKERTLLVRILRGEMRRPDWVAESLHEILPYLVKERHVS